MAAVIPPSAPLIALVGSDGAGKSTVGTELLSWMQAQRPTELCHLGKQTGNIARAISRWPIFGQRFDRVLNDKTKEAEAPTGPSTGIAIIIYLLSMRRVRRFRSERFASFFRAAFVGSSKSSARRKAESCVNSSRSRDVKATRFSFAKNLPSFNF